MPWLKAGDNAATHPLVMALAMVRDADERTTNEVFGFVVRCALQSAGHMTDYRIDLGTAQLLAGTRAVDLLKQAVAAGLMTSTGSGRSKCWQLVDDPEFLHMQLREEVERNRRRYQDKRNRALIREVRHRDGDQCRYCGVVVVWRDRKGPRGATYDHRNIDEPTTAETLVVSCKTCNESRGADPAADERHPLLPPPQQPYYSPSTVNLLRSYGLEVSKTTASSTDGAAERDPDRRVGTPRSRDPRATAPDTAQQERGNGHRPWTSASRPSDDAPSMGGAARGPASPQENAHTQRPADPADTASPPDQPPEWARPDPTGLDADLVHAPDPTRFRGFMPGRVGSGRDGSGAASASAGAGARPAPPPSSPSSQNSRRRGTRGKRGRGPTRGDHS